MTYCIGVMLDKGMIFASDSRTHAGVDNFAKFCKMTVFERRGNRVIVLLSSGNLAGTQAVISVLRQRCADGDAATNLMGARTMFDVVRLVSDATRDIEKRDAGCPRRYGHFVDISTGLVERVGEPSTSSCDGWFRWLRWRRNPVDARRATPPPSIPDRWVTNPRAWPRWLVSNGLCGVGGECAAIVLAVAAGVGVVMDWVVDVSGSGLVRRCGNCCPAGSSDHAGAISHAPAARRSPSTPSRTRFGFNSSAGGWLTVSGRRAFRDDSTAN